MKSYKKLPILLLILFFYNPLFAGQQYERSAIIFAAGNLKFVFPKIIEEFYAKYPTATVHIQYGSSGDLADAIINENRNYDIFFSADTDYPAQVYATNKSETKPKKYARGILILVTPHNPLLQKERIRALKNKNIPYITIANKSFAPYGKATLEALKNSKYYENLKNKIRYSSDVATVINNVTWEGDAGFLSKSVVHMLPKGHNRRGYDWIEVNKNLYHPIIQAYVISKEGLKNNNAMQFLKFLESSQGQKILRDYGYTNITPDE
ncbi:molybdate ABC transporter substrate-binding protein [Sulfurimonas autotrophica]|uniref:Molybdenum ABC transporter, periplasmic molybdate-binding protein n=1 Tax=Sulfurimonas autotrophica (strain ATCC BAA-671 / DSM 16294 / JCM 11897 / OK10) TaxID=563040 RepID=E0UPV9_SULAO|nr:molybdate ABC transporter substrate-binding protein [Sulfurimonas autotrophica]ADN09768.1 molybdenum ABC transporter, periplasmic molybdate-binding protein [Sulfurimonas autotrophica DSM 16294]